jgi:hypothetical protein
MDLVALKARKLESARKSFSSQTLAIGFMLGIAQILGDFNHFAHHVIRVRWPWGSYPSGTIFWPLRIMCINSIPAILCWLPKGLEFLHGFLYPFFGSEILFELKNDFLRKSDSLKI